MNNESVNFEEPNHSSGARKLIKGQAQPPEMESSSMIRIIDISGDASRPARTRRKPRILKKAKEENEAVENADDESGGKERKWGKYVKKYKPQWEKLEVFANWLQRTPENLIMMGKPEAYCLFCQQCLRAHKSDLLAHANSKKHKDYKESEHNNSAKPRDCRSFIESYVPDLEDQAKNDSTYEARIIDPQNTRSKGRPSKRIANKAAIMEQIQAEMEETDEKLQVCEEELNKLRIKKARLEFELEYYENN